MIFTLTELELLEDSDVVEEAPEESTMVATADRVREVVDDQLSPEWPLSTEGFETAVHLPALGAPEPGDDEPVVQSLRAGTLDGTPSKAPINKGQTVGDRYQIVDSIADGGMGRVHRVTHLHLGKTFALKQMHDTFRSDETFRAKFYQEARLASSLSHRNIVSIVDFGEDPNIGVFMVMELVEGDMLSQRLRNREQLPLRMACEVILQIADALHYIHKAGIVHGDIKPDNILLRRAGRSELNRWNICLLDFGLARAQSTISEEEHIEGTPAYMAPEVICGKPLQEASDIYSLGILAYQVVTGTVPFLGELRELMAQHLGKAPMPLAEALGKPVDERLEALIMKALEKDPKNRQASMEAFIFELKTLMDMLGFGRRRGKKVAGKSGSQRSGDRLAKLAFEHCTHGMAVLDAKGEVDVANGAFAYFFHREDEDSRTGMSVMDPRFLRINPELPTDLKQVLEERNTISRSLTFKGGEEETVEFVFTISPLKGEAQKVLLSIIRSS
jgi:tRNA A-37 threonylcarbamoyl transferase component Bud32